MIPALASALPWVAAYVVVMCVLALVVGAFLHVGTAADEAVEHLQPGRAADWDAEQNHVRDALHADRNPTLAERNHA